MGTGECATESGESWGWVTKLPAFPADAWGGEFDVPEKSGSWGEESVEWWEEG